MTDLTEKTLRVIPFDGKAANWRMWSIKFSARAHGRGYLDVLKGTTTVPPHSQVLTDSATDKVLKAARDANLLMYQDIICSCDDPVSFGIVDEAKTEELPDGDANLAWRNLKKKYEPDTGTEKVRLKYKYSTMSLKSAKEDPDIWITELEVIRRQLKILKADISDDDLILHILNNLPKEYETTVEALEDRLGTGELTLEDVRTKLRAKFERMSQGRGGSNPGKEVALMAGKFKKKFKGMCHLCGKQGHKRDDCWQNEANADKRPKNWKPSSNQPTDQSKKQRYSGKCNYCGIRGHKEEECCKKLAATGGNPRSSPAGKAADSSICLCGQL